MANLPESATYDAGVYQLELTDPVQGGSTGVSNAPLKNLANRTAWLKSQIDGIKDGAVGLALYARLASPTFTGSPAAPTAALGDNTTKLATTAFVQKTLGGFLSKSIAGTGSVTLTAVEAGNGIIELTGALTGNRDVIVPSSPTRPWIIRNATTGAFSVTVKTAAGTGVMVAQGTNAEVFCDGTNVRAGESWAAPLASPALTGNPTAPTPARFDRDTSIATTEFVQRALGGFSAVSATSAAYTLTVENGGNLFYIFTGSPFNITLPASGTLQPGWSITFVGINLATVSIVTQGADLIDAINAASALTSAPLGYGESMTMTYIGGGMFVASGANTANMRQAGMFGSSLASSGYQKLPSGLIVQWGTNTIPAGTANNPVTLPIAFPNSFRNVTLGVSLTVVTTFDAPGYSNKTLTGFSISNPNTGVAVVVDWLAVGH